MGMRRKTSKSEELGCRTYARTETELTLVGALEHFVFSDILGIIIIPIDFHIFQRGLVNHQPDQ